MKQVCILVACVQWTYYAVLEAFLNPIIFIMKMRIRKPFEALERKRKANKVNYNGFEIISDGEFVCSNHF